MQAFLSFELEVLYFLLSMGFEPKESGVAPARQDCLPFSL